MSKIEQIKCPKCGEVFQVNENVYATIVKQIKDKEFEKELANKEFSYKEKLEQQNKLNEVKKDLAVTNAVQDYKKQIEIEKAEIKRLKEQLDNQKIIKELEIKSATEKIEKERDKCLSELELQKEIAKNNETVIKEKYKRELEQKDEQIAYYKDFKARLSTKMVGESLEIHCENEFNKIRTTAFPNAQFYKDTDIRTGSKGDFIYKETDENGNEIISIMFDMKNEQDLTATKKRNEDFFKELDKDRNEKNCEYAVLVSLLEMDNELYETGIVDVSYKYPKMYVVRPQCFITIITLLRNAAMKSQEVKNELALIRNQNIDITNFEENIQKFKEGFAKNYKLASNHFQNAIDEIDKTISHLQKVKDSLTSSERQLRIANDKAEDLTIKKLVKNNPTMAKKFEDLRNN